MSTKLILFDFDGTLVDSEAINILAISQIVSSLGYRGYNFTDTFEKFVGLSKKDLIDIMQKDGITEIEEIIHQFNNLALEIASKELKAIDYVTSTLPKLKIPFCVASNGQRELVKKYMGFVGIDKFFADDRIFTSEEVQNPKPHPDLFLHAAKEMGSVKASDCLVLEDTVIGVTAAHRANIRAIGIIPKKYNEEIYQKKEKALLNAGASKVINKFSELLLYI